MRKTVYHSEGYVLAYDRSHPRSHNGYVYEHILVWEEANGTPVPAGHQVHHKNGIKNDNRPENLEVLSRQDHGRHHMTSDRARRMQALAAERRRRNGSYARTRGPRSSHCKYGHPKERRPNGKWVCPECHRITERDRHARKRASR